MIEALSHYREPLYQMSKSKSSKKAAATKSKRKTYRDKSGKFITKEKWISLQPKKATKKKAVKKKRAPTVKKKKAKKKKAKAKVERCNYSKVFELHDVHQINKYNVTGVANLSIYCLAKLIDSQIKRGAKLFRFWYRGNAYHKDTEEGTVRSTPLINSYRVQKEFGSIENFLQSLTGPVIYYWMDIYA